MLCDAKRTASVRAETYCNLYSLSRDDFQHVLSDFPVMRRTIESIAAERLTQIGRDPNLVSEREDLQDDLQIVKELLQSLAANMHTPNSDMNPNEAELTTEVEGQDDSKEVSKSRQHKKGPRMSSASKDEDMLPGELNPRGKVKHSALARFARVGDLLFHSHDSTSHSRVATTSGEREHNVRASFFLGGRSGSSGGGNGGGRGVGVNRSGSGDRSHSSSDAEIEAAEPTPTHNPPSNGGGEQVTAPADKRHYKFRFPHPHFTWSTAAAASTAKRSSLQPNSSIIPKRHNSVNADLPHLAKSVGVQLAHGDQSLLASCTALH